MANWIGSPNYTSGRFYKLDMIVIHWMVGTLASTDAVFQNKSRQTSAHYGIEDTNVHQYVDEANTAYHAGNSTMNARSIGIEHSAAPGRDATQPTLETSARLIADICKRYSIPIDRAHIIKHSEVPYQTQCSGTIDIDWLVKRAKEINETEGVKMLDKNRVNQIITAFHGAPANQTDYDIFVGKPYETLLDYVTTSSSRKQYLKRIEDAENGVVDKSAILKYISNNLK